MYRNTKSRVPLTSCFYSVCKKGNVKLLPEPAAAQCSSCRTISRLLSCTAVKTCELTLQIADCASLFCTAYDDVLSEIAQLPLKDVDEVKLLLADPFNVFLNHGSIARVERPKPAPVPSEFAAHGVVFQENICHLADKYLPLGDYGPATWYLRSLLYSALLSLIVPKYTSQNNVVCACFIYGLLFQHHCIRDSFTQAFPVIRVVFLAVFSLAIIFVKNLST